MSAVGRHATGKVVQLWQLAGIVNHEGTFPAFLARRNESNMAAPMVCAELVSPYDVVAAG